MSGRARIGIDVGGTVTDVVVSSGGTMTHGKADTTAYDLRVGVHNALQEVAGALGSTAEDLLTETESMVYSTTVGTNALVEHKVRCWA